MRPMMFYLHSYNSDAVLRFTSSIASIEGVTSEEFEKFLSGELERLVSKEGTFKVNFKDGSHVLGYMLSAVVPY